jgi:hypothetical protein
LAAKARERFTGGSVSSEVVEAVTDQFKTGQ